VHKRAGVSVEDRNASIEAGMRGGVWMYVVLNGRIGLGRRKEDIVVVLIYFVFPVSYVS